MYIEEADRRSIGPRDVRELQKCLDVHVQNERGREDEDEGRSVSNRRTIERERERERESERDS